MSAPGLRNGAFHLASHQALLQQADSRDVGGSGRPASLDAVVVPTVKPWSLAGAISLARDLGSALVVLSTTPEQAALARRACRCLPGEVLATYVPPSADADLFSFLTSQHPESQAEPGCHIDIARKRNVALLLARLRGWRTILFLDDDIRGMTASAVRTAVALTSRFQAAGFEIAYYPDNSVVCHAYRLAGGGQGVFPGGSALVVDVPRSDTPFPPVYDEDWLFLFDAVQRRSVTVAGALSQLAYQPFAHPQRAASEEFGDVIAEGLFRVLHEGGTAADATASYWRCALEQRSLLIEEIAARLLVTEDDPPTAAAALNSLTAARKRLADITDVGCDTFVRAWRADVEAWRERLTCLPFIGDLPGAAGYLGLPSHDEVSDFSDL